MSASRGAGRWEPAVCWALLGAALLVAGQATLDAWRQVGQPYPGFFVMENLLVAVGGARDRGGLEPFDFVRAVDGQVLDSGREIQAAARAHPPGTTFRYIVSRRGQLVEAEIATVLRSAPAFHRFLVEGLLAGLIFLGLGAVVLWLKPGAPQTRLFLAFSLTWFCIPALYLDAHMTYRFSALFLAAFAVSPAIFVHLALAFPERLEIARRHPRIVWLPYLGAAVLAAPLGGWVPPPSPVWRLAVPAAGAVYWGASLLLLVLALARTARRGGTPLVRQRARVLVTGFAAGLLVPVLGTTVEAVLRVEVPYLNDLWRLNFLFLAAVAYAMVRYNLFDLRAVIRLGAIYAAVTALVALAYAGSLTALNVGFARLGVAGSPVVSAVILSLAVVLFLNPVYTRTQRVVDRLFFRQRLDVQRSIEELADRMTTELDLARIVRMVGASLAGAVHPERLGLLLLDEAGARYRSPTGSGGLAGALAAGGSLAGCLQRRREPLTRERHAEDPALAGCRDGCLREMDALGADLVAPVLFRERLAAIAVLGPKRSGGGYTTEDLRLVRLVANQSAVAMENARAYTALESANAELRATLRRVEILESVRASLAKFVPRTVQALIERAPEAPALDKRDADVSVLFVDIAGYARLSERLPPERVNRMVERYFGAFLDEILRHGGDVNETAGDGLMVIFQHEDPGVHGRAAVETALEILRRAREINAEGDAAPEPIALHVGVNSGTATVGVTKIEGTAGTRWTYTATGPVTNVAARLAALGAGEGIMVGPETRRRVGDAFPFEDLGERRLRHVEEPVRVFRLVEPDAGLPLRPPPDA